jgi:ribosomal protein S18 acetylase RimI-like enzyme
MVEPAFDEQLLSRVEDASLNASAAQQQRWLDGWILRYCPGKARRSRCINAVAAGRLPLEEKLALSADLFRVAEVPMLFRVTRFSLPTDLDQQLHDRGWSLADATRVQVKRLPPAAPLRALPAGMRWELLGAADFAEAVGTLRGTPPEHRRLHAQRLAQAPVPHRGYVIRRETDGAVLACGQTAQEAELVGVYDVHTADSVRGLGLAGLLCERMLTLSAAGGAKIAYLQVESGNQPALRVYARLGFVDGYTYHYREAPAA